MRIHNMTFDCATYVQYTVVQQCKKFEAVLTEVNKYNISIIKQQSMLISCVLTEQLWSK